MDTIIRLPFLPTLQTTGSREGVGRMIDVSKISFGLKEENDTAIKNKDQ